MTPIRRFCELPCSVWHSLRFRYALLTTWRISFALHNSSNIDHISSFSSWTDAIGLCLCVNDPRVRERAIRFKIYSFSSCPNIAYSLWLSLAETAAIHSMSLVGRQQISSWRECKKIEDFQYWIIPWSMTKSDSLHHRLSSPNIPLTEEAPSYRT